jgi:hypothetical protein
MRSLTFAMTLVLAVSASAAAQQAAAPTPNNAASVTPVGVDPLYESQVTGLQGYGGFLERFGAIGESVLLLDRQLQFAKKVDELIQVMGPDARVEIAPGQTISVGDWPSAVRLRFEMEQLEGQAAIPPIAGPGAGGDSVASVPPASVAEPTVGMVSLREVMASGGSYSAVMVVGVERMRVKIGDDLPGGLTVAGIGKDWVELSTGAGSMRLTMRD